MLVESRALYNNINRRKIGKGVKREQCAGRICKNNSRTVKMANFKDLERLENNLLGDEFVTEVRVEQLGAVRNDAEDASTYD